MEIISNYLEEEGRNRRTAPIERGREECNKMAAALHWPEEDWLPFAKRAGFSDDEDVENVEQSGPDRIG